MSVLLAVALFIFEGRVLFVIFAGVLLALSLHGASTFIAKKTGAPRGAVLAILAAAIAASIAFGGYFLGAAAAAQASSFAQQVPQAWHSAVVALMGKAKDAE